MKWISIDCIAMAFYNWMNHYDSLHWDGFALKWVHWVNALGHPIYKAAVTGWILTITDYTELN